MPSLDPAQDTSPFINAEVGELALKLREAEAMIERLESELQKEADVNEQLRSDIEHLSRSIRDSQRIDSYSVSSDRSDVVQAGLDVTYEATFYTAMCDGCSGITASGLDVRNTILTPEGLRVIAVDPSYIALGTKVRVTYADGTSFKAEASDVGGDIKGRRIDVLVATKEEALKLGRQDVSVLVLE